MNKLQKGNTLLYLLLISSAILGIIVITFVSIQYKTNIKEMKSAQAVSSASPVNAVSPSVNSFIAKNALSQNQLVALADNKYADGNLPLGDNKYVTDKAKKGYIYLCHAQKDIQGGGAQAKGSWIHGDNWNIKQKISITGKNTWATAQFSNTVSNQTRILSGNDLPINHTTGTFPVLSTDSAYKIDKNPNSIKPQSFSDEFPVNPTYSDTPYCVGGEVGIMLTGVALFDGFDATLRDAAANEVQDSCSGHPQNTGEYHYHSLSSCINDVSVQTVIGFALDGFPITGPMVEKNKNLTTEDLDECHGIISEYTLDGKKVVGYHYVMTQDFPYSVSCFRGKPVTNQVVKSANTSTSQNSPDQNTPKNSSPQQPPQAALIACSGKNNTSNCSFTTPNGQISGTCQLPPGSATLTCVPANPIKR